MQYSEDTSPIRNFFRNKYVRIILAVDFIIVIITIGIFIYNSTKTATVDILTIPSIAKVKIGSGAYNSGTYRIHPGDYNAEISADGFQTKTVPIEAKAGEISKIYVYLIPNDNTFDWYTLKENYDDFEQLAAIASSNNNATTDQDTSAEEFISDFSHKISIMNILPLEYEVLNESDMEKSQFFAINLNPECDYTNSCLLIQPIVNATHEEILNHLKSKNYNPDDYDIVFEENISL